MESSFSGLCTSPLWINLSPEKEKNSKKGRRLGQYSVAVQIYAKFVRKRNAIKKFFHTINSYILFSSEGMLMQMMTVSMTFRHDVTWRQGLAL